MATTPLAHGHHLLNIIQIHQLLPYLQSTSCWNKSQSPLTRNRTTKHKPHHIYKWLNNKENNKRKGQLAFRVHGDSKLYRDEQIRKLERWCIFLVVSTLQPWIRLLTGSQRSSSSNLNLCDVNPTTTTSPWPPFFFTPPLIFFWHNNSSIKNKEKFRTNYTIMVTSPENW